MNPNVTRLMNNARIHLPGAIDGTLQLELFNVFDTFFKDSNIWQEEIPFTVMVDTKTYSIEQTSISAINRLLFVKRSDGFGVEATMAVPGEIRLRHPPAQADTYTATVSMTINDPVAEDGFPEFPSWVLTKYGDGILEGLIGRMMAQPAKPYTNSQLAIFHMRKFIGAVSLGKIEALHRNLNNGQTWRFPQSFATRQRRI